MWALGDYHRFAKQTVWEVGPVLVEACGISAGSTRARRGRGHRERGHPRRRDRREGRGVGPHARELRGRPPRGPRARGGARVGGGRRRGASLRRRRVRRRHLLVRRDVRPRPPGRWPTSCCASAGREARSGWSTSRPRAWQREFFETLRAATRRRLPPGALPPLLWGSEEHVRELFGDRVESLELTRREYVERAASPRDYVELFKQTFGPVVALYAILADQPDRAGGARARVPRVRHAREPRRAERAGRVPLRVPARRRAHAPWLSRTRCRRRQPSARSTSGPVARGSPSPGSAVTLTTG